VTDRKAQSTISRWSIAAAVFGAVCNVLCLVLNDYQSYYLERIQPVWDDWLNFPEAISLAPLLVLLILRHFTPVVLLYTFMLFSILSWRIHHLVQYYFFGGSAGFYKIDMPGLLLFFLGGISIAVVLVWATIHFVVFIRHTLKRSRPAS
jgi:hypothetical protein